MFFQARNALSTRAKRRTTTGESLQYVTLPQTIQSDPHQTLGLVWGHSFFPLQFLDAFGVFIVASWCLALSRRLLRLCNCKKFLRIADDMNSPLDRKHFCTQFIIRQSRSGANDFPYIYPFVRSVVRRLSACRPSHSCTLLKPFDGFTCHLAGTLCGPMIEWHIVLDGGSWPPGEG